MAIVVHLGKYSFPYRGGIETVIEEAADAAVRDGNKVTIIGFSAENEVGVRIRGQIVDVCCRINGVLASQPLGFNYLLKAILIGRTADIVHLHLPNMLAAFAVIFIGKRPKLLVHWHSDVVGKDRLLYALNWLQAFVLRRATKIICTSPAYADSSAPIQRYKNKVFIIPIGVSDISTQQIQTDPIISKISNLIGNRRVVLSVGRLVQYKGFDILIQAAQMFTNNAVCVIVGEGPLSGLLSDYCRKLGVSDRVVFFGKASQVELDSLFRCASVFCLASNQRSEAFGAVLVEAMRYQLPIVACKIQGSGVPWVNQDGYSGINVPINNPMLLAEACNKLLENEDLRLNLAKGARERYNAEFSLAIFQDRVNFLYREMLAGL